MYAAGRPGNDGLVYKYDDRKKHGDRCCLGRYFEVCHRHYSTPEQEVRGILC